MILRLGKFEASLKSSNVSCIYIDQMTGNAKDLVPLAMQCLNEASDTRPSMISVSETVKRLKDSSPDVNINPILLLQQVFNPAVIVISFENIIVLIGSII